eukprot:5961998-Prymnesium_polylepis.1
MGRRAVLPARVTVRVTHAHRRRSRQLVGMRGRRRRLERARRVARDGLESEGGGGDRLDARCRCREGRAWACERACAREVGRCAGWSLGRSLGRGSQRDARDAARAGSARGGGSGKRRQQQQQRSTHACACARGRASAGPSPHSWG